MSLIRLKVRDTCCHLRWGHILTITDAPRSFSCRSLLMESQKSGVGRRPLNVFDVCGRTRIWIINADLQDLIAGCTTGCQVSHRSTGFLWIGSCVSSNSGDIMTKM